MGGCAGRGSDDEVRAALSEALLQHDRTCCVQGIKLPIFFMESGTDRGTIGVIGFQQIVMPRCDQMVLMPSKMEVENLVLFSIKKNQLF